MRASTSPFSRLPRREKKIATAESKKKKEIAWSKKELFDCVFIVNTGEALNVELSDIRLICANYVATGERRHIYSVARVR